MKSIVVAASSLSLFFCACNRTDVPRATASTDRRALAPPRPVADASSASSWIVFEPVVIVGERSVRTPAGGVAGRATAARR